MNRRALILLLLCLPAIAGQSAIAQKPRLVVIYKPGCPPCHVFFWLCETSPKFRQALDAAFDLRELDVSRPADQLKAAEYGVTVVPTFVAIRGNKRLAKSEGFAWTTRPNDVRPAVEKLMLDLGVEWPRVIAPPDTSPPRVELPDIEIDIPPARTDDPPTYVPHIDETARAGLDTLAAESRKLREEANALQKSQQETADAIKQQLADTQASTQAELRAIAEQLRKPVEPKPVTPPECDPITGQCPIDARPDPQAPKPSTSSAPDISTEIPSGPTASKWLKVGKWIAGTAVAVAAPEFAIPLSVGMTVVGWLATRVRNRKGSGHRPDTFPVVTESAAVKTSATKGYGTPLPREYNEAVELLQLAEREGRIPIHEAIRGTLADDEIDRLTESIDPTTRQLGVELRDRIARRFNTVAPISQDPSKYQE